MRELKQLIRIGERVDVECKRAADRLPGSVYESYSAFANTNGGCIILGVREDKTKDNPKERFIVEGVKNPEKQREDLWNTLNSNKVSVNLLKDENVSVVEEDGIRLVVIEVPRADFTMRPVYIGENPYKGTYKRNYEGDYHASEYEVSAMIRDRNPDGNDNMIIEYYDMEDIDQETFRNYRRIFELRNEGHVWNPLDDRTFLEKLGGYRKDRGSGVEGLTLAGLMMFGTGQAVREKFDNIFMDYRNECTVTADIRWNDRVTYDGMWENNLFNFFMKVTPKLTEDLKQPFRLEGMQRIDETPVHKAIREAFVNMIIHADYLMDAGVLRIIKRSDEFAFTNPGSLKLPLEEIYRGGNSRSRNPHMQTMLRLIGFGDNAGSGFPAILAAWEKEGWVKPELVEDTKLNQVTLFLRMTRREDKNVIENVIENVRNNVIEKNEDRFEKQIEARLPAYSKKKISRAAEIIRMMEDNPKVSMDEMRRAVNVTERTIARYLADLKAHGMIARDGSHNGGCWKVLL